MHEGFGISRILLRYGWRSAAAAAVNPKAKGLLRGMSRFGIVTSLLMFFHQLSRSLRNMIDPSSVAGTLNEWQLLPCDSEICRQMMMPSAVWPELLQLFWLGIAIAVLLSGGIIGSALLLPFSPLNVQRDFEWLRSYPIKLRAFLWGRLIHGNVVSLGFLMVMFPLVSLFIYYRGLYSGWAVLGPLFFAWNINFMATSLGATLEVHFGKRLRREQQTFVRILSILLSTFAMSLVFFSLYGLEQDIWSVIYRNADLIQNSPLIQALELFFRPDFPGFLPVLILLSLSLGIGVSCVRLMERCLLLESRHEQNKTGSWKSRAGWLQNIPLMVRRDLLMLRRHPYHLATLLILPMTFMVLLSWPFLRGETTDSPHFLLVLVLSISLMTIGLDSVRAVQGESEALPFYAATPRKLSGLIKEKQKLWLVLVLIAMGPYLWWIIPKESWTSPDFLLRYGLGIITVWLFARHICSLALLHHDPSTGSMKRPTKHVLSASFLGPLLGFSIGLGHLWTVVTLVLFHAGLVWAYQQKLRQYEPYILDPVMAPPVRADLQDGLIAAFYYAILLNAGFVFTLLLFIPQPHSMPVATLLPPLAVMFGLYRRYRKSADSDVPVWFGSIRAGDAVLMIMLLVGLNDVSRFSHQNMAHWEFWKKIYEVPLYLTNDYKASPVFWTIAGLGLLLANEFIFRGLIQSGMTARFGFLKAWLLSGVLAALCQPPETPMTVANNLAVALASGFLFQRTQVLWPGLLVAIIFNLSVLFG